MVNHPNRKVVDLSDFDGYMVPVRRKFKKNSLFKNIIHTYYTHKWVEVYVNFLDRVVYLHTRYEIGQTMDEVNGDAVSAKLFDLDPPRCGEMPDEENCLAVARLMQDYLDVVEEVGDKQKSVIFGVLSRPYLDPDDSQEVREDKVFAVFWEGVNRLQNAISAEKSSI